MGRIKRRVSVSARLRCVSGWVAVVKWRRFAPKLFSPIPPAAEPGPFGSRPKTQRNTEKRRPMNGRRECGLNHLIPEFRLASFPALIAPTVATGVNSGLSVILAFFGRFFGFLSPTGETFVLGQAGVAMSKLTIFRFADSGAFIFAIHVEFRPHSPNKMRPCPLRYRQQ